MKNNKNRKERKLNELKTVKEFNSAERTRIVGGIINDGKQDQLKSSFIR